MTVPTAVMLDTIGANAHNIPGATSNIAGYVTGIGDVPWTGDEWALFPHARHYRIAQGAGVKPVMNGYDIIDVEAGTYTPEEAASMTAARVAAGIQWTTVYGSDDTLARVTEAILAHGRNVWNGHVNYWLADWNLNAEEAAAKLGTEIHGASCVAVQWASPTSNPNTVVPGGGATLRVANIDISVIDANWLPSGGFTGHPVTPKPVVVHNGMLITVLSNGEFAAKAVTSDDTVTWK